MHPFIQNLIRLGPVITDGSWGTQLHKRGLTAGENPDCWNLSHPEKIREIARLYVDAGSQVILTNTFGANRFVLENFNLGDKVREINTAGVKISKQVAGSHAAVFASIGPSGKMLLTGQVQEEDLESAFTAQAQAQAQAGADAIVIETMTDVNEAVIAARAAKSTGLPVIACMVFDSGKDKDRTMMGNTPEQVVEALEQIHADAIGANCGQGIKGFIDICKRMRITTDLPLWMKPNAGLPEFINGETVFKTTADEFAQYVPELIQSGANFIGGCCGTNEEFIQKIGEIIG